ncbi:hypothetical protein [Pseudenhygromyxa sp. WMMC2535]|uniref:hypothetical protein n=1 Tax=Pseudenhygromyxa sp. WMMC2535 TaxID=2712867 RepID=UPI0020D01249|nr:hypothetical protein [Pseudenhygromyxa sp. WMMC2535]
MALASIALSSVSSACVEPQTESAALDDSSVRAAQGYARNPPRIEEAKLEFLSNEASANARLSLRYAKGEVEALTLALELEGEKIVLRDDGEGGDLEPKDGIYSALIGYDLAAEAERRQRHLDRAAQLEPRVTRFAGRDVVERVAFDPGALDFVLDGEAVSPAQLLELAGALKGSSLTVSSGPGASVAMAATTDPEKTLAIRDLAVTRDTQRTGVWSWDGAKCSFSGDAFGDHGFSRLMEEMSVGAGIAVEDWTADWLRTWSVPQVVNGDDLSAEVSGLSEVWNRFPQLSSDGDPYAFNDVLDMNQPPFQLVAIVNRVDLHEAGSYGGGAGELRYVFQLVDPDSCAPLDMTVIFEYEVPRSGCSQIRSYAQAWYDLDDLALGSQDYLDALAAITEPVTAAGANPQHVAGSALGQLRTNSRILPWPHYAGLQWHMRAFVHNGVALEPAPMRMTPAFGYEYPDIYTSAQAIDDFIDAEAADILAGTYDVDLLHPVSNDPFRAGFVPYGHLSFTHYSPYAAGEVVYFDPYVSASATVPAGSLPGSMNWWGMERGRFWGSQLADPEARHVFSLNTCNGCHARETFDDGGTLYVDHLSYGLSRSVAGAVEEPAFMHMRLRDPVDAGPAIFSRFLTGTDDGCVTASGLVPPLGSETCTASCCPVGDPVHGPDAYQYHYDDLARRGQALEATVTNSCLYALTADAEHVALSLSAGH